MRYQHLLLGMLLGAASARAQSSPDETAAFLGLTLTPVGALPMLQLSPGALAGSQAPAVAVRLASSKVDETTNRTTTFGGTISAPVSRFFVVEGTLAWHEPGGLAGGSLMGGADVQSPLWDSPADMDRPVSLTIFGRAGIGLGHISGSGNGTAYSIAGALPIRLRYGLSSKSDFSFFFSPGLGWGGISGGDLKGDGTRAIISFGAGLTASNGIGVHLGTQQVVLDEDPPWIVGLSLSFPLVR